MQSQLFKDYSEDATYLPLLSFTFQFAPLDSSSFTHFTFPWM